jgi:hypothetical protein
LSDETYYIFILEGYILVDDSLRGTLTNVVEKSRVDINGQSIAPYDYILENHKGNSVLLKFIRENPASSSRAIHLAAGKGSFATTKREINALVKTGQLVAEGQSRATRYRISSTIKLFAPIDLASYFEKEIDDREIQGDFNFSLITDVLGNVDLFTPDEVATLAELQAEFRTNVSQMSSIAYTKEMERLAIDLSWKSSQIEGNTYSLLETERLLKDKETAAGKPKDDATMLLNHKEALHFILENPDYVVPLSIARIEDVHSILIKDLEVKGAGQTLRPSCARAPRCRRRPPGLIAAPRAPNRAWSGPATAGSPQPAGRWGGRDGFWMQLARSW